MTKPAAPVVSRRVQPPRKCKRLPEVPIPDNKPKRPTRPKRANETDNKQPRATEAAALPKRSTETHVRRRAPPVLDQEKQLPPKGTPKRKSQEMSETATESKLREQAKISSGAKGRKPSNIRAKQKAAKAGRPNAEQQSRASKRPRTPNPTTRPSDSSESETIDGPVPKDMDPSVNPGSSGKSISEEGSFERISTPPAVPTLLKAAQAIEVPTNVPPTRRLTEREQMDLPDFVPEVLPEGHKLVHLLRHCRAWHK